MPKGKYARTKEHNKNVSLALIGKKWPKEKFPNHGMRNKKMSEETKLKMSKAQKGRIITWGDKISIANSGKNNPMYHRKVSDAHKEKISLKLKGTRLLDKNPAWLGGKSFEPYNIKFDKNLKNLVIFRDNNKCQICKKGSRHTLSIHHIDYNKKNSNFSNLVAICKSCHGHTNSNRAYWQYLFFSEWLKINKFKQYLYILNLIRKHNELMKYCLP